jgi:Flp pilus assembly protein TadD
MDRIAPLRRESAAVKELQKGRAMLGKKKIREADSHFRNALAKAPEDYAGLLMMAKTLIKEEEYGSALNYCSRAREVYPSEPQALHVEGIALLNSESYERAYADFSEYERRLPGNINTVFYKGLSLEKMGRRKDAAGEYMKFCRSKGSGEKYHYALKRLKEWGYVREEKDGNGKNDQSGNTKK